MTRDGIIKHRKVFNAWLDGKTIEYHLRGSTTWMLAVDPKWYTDIEYRVKPEPVKVKVAVFDWVGEGSPCQKVVLETQSSRVSDAWNRVSDWVEIEVKEIKE